MPVIENPGDWIIGSRFTFERDSSAPNPGLKDVGTYYTFNSDQTVAAAAGLLGLGLQGYIQFKPRMFGMEWQKLARSSPAPKYFGAFDERVIELNGLYFHGRNRNEVETFVRELPDRIGPFEGLLRVYDTDFSTLLYGWPQCFLREVSITDDGSKNFVEYNLTFATVQKQMTAQQISALQPPVVVYNPDANLPEFFA